MKVELVNAQTATERAAKLKDIAWSIAEANQTTPGYCQAEECKSFCDYLSVSQLNKGEVCVFVDGLAARQLTDFELKRGKFIGKMCADNLVNAYINNSNLILEYADGVKEEYIYLTDIESWQHSGGNSKLLNNLQSRGIN